MQNASVNILREVVEKGFGNADMEIIDKLINENWIEHQFTLQGGKEVLKKAILSLEAAFSNRRYQLINHAANGNMVWGHFSFTAVHTGSFMGHAPTGKKITIDVMDIVRIEHGQIVEHWGIPDRFALMMQLGFIHPGRHQELRN